MNEKYWIAFSAIEQLDSTFIQRLYNYFGDIETAYNAQLSDLKQIEGLSIKKAENFIEKRKSINPDKALDEVVGGKGYKAVAAVGRVISFPFRAVAYGTGAILGGLPKGFVDGVYDAWTNWKDYDEEDSNKRRR